MTGAMMSLRALVIDDEPLARQRLASLLAEDPEISSVEEAGDVSHALRMIRSGCPDIVFLDVEMPDGNGFSVLSNIENTRIPSVVFVTAYEQYAVRAFENNASDYLLKPVTRERFRTALTRAKTRAISPHSAGPGSNANVTGACGAKYLDRLAVRSRGGVRLVNIQDIRWIEAAENYVQVHSTRQDYMIHATLNDVVRSLDPKVFLRVHRSAVVNLLTIAEVHPISHGEYVLVLQDGTRVRTARTYAALIRSLFSNPF